MKNIRLFSMLLVVLFMASTCDGWSSQWRGITYKEEALAPANLFPQKWNKDKSNKIIMWKRGCMSRDILVPEEWKANDGVDWRARCPGCGKDYRGCSIVSYEKEGPMWAWFVVRCEDDGEEFDVFEQISQCIMMGFSQ